VELTNRQMLLIKLLMKESEMKTAEYLANKLHVSTRTVHSDIKKMELYVHKLGFKLVRKRGVGIKLIGNKKAVEFDHSDTLTPKLLYGVKERRIQIIRRLLFNQETVTLSNLADHYFVSKSSINNDLNFIKEQFLNQSTVQLVSDTQGTRIEGTEQELQNTLVLFNALISKYEAKKMAFSENKQQKYDFLNELYGKELVEICHNSLYKFAVNKLELIADYYVYNILSIIIVLTYRASLGHHIQAKSLKQSINSNQPNIILEEISGMTGIKFTKGDATYLNRHMAANKMSLGEIDMDFKPIIEKILVKVSKMLKVDLTKDNKLSSQLEKHFPSMIYRLKHNYSVQNPFITQIKHEFGLMYNITWFVMSGFEDQLDIKFTENEIGFLMIYFQSALDRMQLRKRVLIICPTGITMSGLLLNRVRKILPPLDLIEIASFDEMTKVNLKKVDFIISTAHIKVQNTPLIVVSPLISNDDMENISRFYNANFVLTDNKRKAKKEVHYCLTKIKPYIDKRLIEFDCEYKCMTEAMHDVIDNLVAKGYVNTAYKESVFERMRVGDIVLPTGVAIPHGNPQFVKKSVLAIYVNKKPLKWNEQLIHVVFFICISKRDLQHVKEILSCVYNLIEDKETVEQLWIKSSKDKFISLLGSGIS
jgi:activator of the mannose operon, transcriptional antiterminator